MRVLERVGRTIRRLVIVRRHHLYFWAPGSELVDCGNEPGLDFLFPCDIRLVAPTSFDGGAEEWTDLLSRTEGGEELAILTLHGAVAHRALVRREGYVNVEGDRRARRIQPGEFYIHYCETAAGSRGRGLYPAALTRIVRCLRDRPDFLGAVIGCNVRNTASIRGIRKAGFSYLGSCFTIGLLGERLAWTSFRRDPSQAREGI